MLCYVEYYAEILISKLLGAFIKAMCKNLKILCLFVGQNFFLSFVSSWFLLQGMLGYVVIVSKNLHNGPQNIYFCWLWFFIVK